MLRITDLKLPLDHADEALPKAIRARLKLGAKESLSFTVAKRSYDARKRGAILLIYALDIDTPREAELLEQLKDCTDRPLKERLERRLMVRRDVGEGKSRTVSTTLVQLGDAFLVGAPAETYDKPGLYQIKISLFQPGCMEQVIDDTAKSLRELETAHG